MTYQHKYRYYLQLIMLATLVVLMSACWSKNKALTVDTELNLAGNDQGPMGASVFRHFSQKAFSNDSLFNNIKPFEKWHTQLIHDDSYSNKLVYIIAAPRMIASQQEVESMADFVESGNTLLVIADYFTEEFLQRFSVTSTRTFIEGTKGKTWEMRATQKKLIDSTLFSSRKFGYYFYPFLNEIGADSSLKPEYEGINDAGQPDFVRVNHGKGQLIVVTNAAALCNYFLLSGNNYQYALAVLSYLPAFSEGIYWDDFYRRHPYRSFEKSSLLSTILAIPGFRWAFALLLAAGIFWMGTEIWRRQRIIPVQDKYKNTTLEFNQTIARLYLNNHDNQNIAAKMIAHLSAFLQTRYFIRNIEMNDELAGILTAKTGLDIEKMRTLVAQLRRVQEGENPDDATLLWINQEIQNISEAGMGNKKRKEMQTPNNKAII